jgi:hypothetical protein
MRRNEGAPAVDRAKRKLDEYAENGRDARQWLKFAARYQPPSILASLLVGKAGAEQPPQLLPTSDVDIIYQVTVPSQPRIRERVRYLAAELLERVDGPHKSTTIFRAHQMTILTSANRTFLKFDMPQQPEEPGPKATLKRGNESVVAGIALR